MRNLKFSLILVALFITACVTDPTRDGYWRRELEIPPIITINVDPDLQKCKEVSENSLACAVVSPIICRIYFADEIHKVDSWLLKHELMHCQGWLHD